MCGLTGILGRPGLDPERTESVRRMTATLVHRGPDGEGYAARDGCDLGFRRLAIVDLEAASPPFPNEDRTIWTVCNGEIYNGLELMEWLESRGHRFHTSVDTEVLPHLYEELGLDLVERLDGMFAFAIWDETRRRLVLGRDRAGEKPLFYRRHEGGLAFASELRALLALPRVPWALDPVALRRYLLHDFFPAPLSPIAELCKLPAGHLLVAENGDVTLRKYWDLADYFERAENPAQPERVADEIDRRIALAVERRRRSDVPVGVFLSGGIDSSTILAHMAEQTGEGVPVFAVGNSEAGFDEAQYAVRTARHFKADYHELILDEAQLDEGLRLVAEGFDEPLGDASIIPSHLLARFARREVKVILSGEGADELFAGYPTYPGDRVARALRRMPRSVLRGVSAASRILPTSMGNVGLDYLLDRFNSAARLGQIERHHSWFGSLAPGLHGALLSERVLGALGDDDPFAAARERLNGRSLPDPLAVLLYTDFSMYLQDDLLTKVDRATMLASLEARAPFLDHELAEFVAGLPSRWKLRRFTGKWILRRAVRKRLPAEILSRRKRGFNIPFSRWLLHGLGERLRERFSEERVRERGLFNPTGLARLLDEHLSRRVDHRKPLFTLLVLDLWCDRTFGEGSRIPLSVAADRSAAPEEVAR